MPRHDEGFSLLELLIVVAIIIVIAAIAIPSLLRSKIAANQASAIESLRVLGTSEVELHATLWEPVRLELVSRLPGAQDVGLPVTPQLIIELLSR